MMAPVRSRGLSSAAGRAPGWCAAETAAGPAIAGLAKRSYSWPIRRAGTLRKAATEVWAAGCLGHVPQGACTRGAIATSALAPLLLSSQDRSSPLVSAQRAALVLPSGRPRGDRPQPGGAKLVYLLLMR